MEDSLSWVPDSMDSSSATRIDVRVCAYAEVGDNGTQVWHQTRNELKILDKDCVNFKDFSDELDEEIKRGLNQKLLITFWDKISLSFAEINHDTLLLSAIDMYWDERRLPIMVSVVNQGESSTSACVQRVQQLTAPLNSTDKPPQQQPTDIEHSSEHESSSSEEPPVHDDWVDDWVDAEVEYVGVDDECEYKELLTDSDESNRDDGYDSDQSFPDDLVVDDTLGCETIVHVTDFENPKIEVGVTFEDGKSFKKAIRQYAIKDFFCSRQRQLDLDSAAIQGMCTPTKQLASTVHTNSPMTRSRKKQLGLDAPMRKASKVAAKPKSMKKTTRKLGIKRAKN